jgi:acetolactate synthase I/II/III large subunit
MPVKVYERILQLFEAEGISTIFGIPDPNFVHMFHLAEERGWNVVAPHHEESAGFMAEAVSRMTGTAAVCVGTLGPGVANLAGAMMCAKVENSPVIFLGGQRARITEQRVRRGRIQFVRQSGLFEPSVKYCASIEYADQTDEVIREGLRKALTGTPGPVYIEYPIHVISEELDAPPPLPPAGYRLVHQTAGPDKIAEAVRFIGAARQPSWRSTRRAATGASGASSASTTTGDQGHSRVPASTSVSISSDHSSPSVGAEKPAPPRLGHIGTYRPPSFRRGRRGYQ